MFHNRKPIYFALAFVAACLVFTGCSSKKESRGAYIPPGLSKVQCPGGKADLEIIGVGDFKGQGQAAAEWALSDLRSYLKAASGGSCEVEGKRAMTGAEAESLASASTRKNIIMVSTSGALAGTRYAPAGAMASEDFLITLSSEGEKKVYVAAGGSPLGAAYAAYELLHETGVRFYHAADEYVPNYGGIYLPENVNIHVSHKVGLRGIHQHLLHPTEFFPVFNRAGEENLKQAKQYLLWLVKNGQNYLQFNALNNLDFSTWFKHTGAIVEYAHSLGIKVGICPIFWGGASFQNSYVLIKSAESADWKGELHSNIDNLMQVPWDVMSLGMGEFGSADLDRTIEWFNEAAGYFANKYPASRFAVQIHVGDYENLYVDYKGERLLYYFIPKFADPKLGVFVHTVMFYDLYQDAGAYNHRNFYTHRQFLLSQLGVRDTYYYPESAYWCAFDIDVPQFFPVYIYSRHNDITSLQADIEAMGLAPLKGHIEFSTGNEWGYWMNDYSVSRTLARPGTTIDDISADLGAAYGAASQTVSEIMAEMIRYQKEMLIDKKMVAYFASEDFYYDMGQLVGIETHPKRLPLEDVAKYSESELAAFEAGDLARLAEIMDKYVSLRKDLVASAGLVPGGALRFFKELDNCLEINRLRAAHSLNLYEAVVKKARGDAAGAKALLDAAAAVRARAGQVIQNQEKLYRYDLNRYIHSEPNETIYPFGYLKQAHTLCYWERPAKQAEYVVLKGKAATISDLPNCID
jgi:hypothetical protein